MKRLISLLLAALLLLSLAACRPVEPGPEAPETPETPETPEGPQTQVTPEPPEPPEIPEAPDAPEEPELPEAGSAAVSAAVYEDSVDELVSYHLELPEIEVADPAVAQLLNDYYEAAADKLRGMASGELFELAQDEHCAFHLEADFTVARCEGGLLSIYRSVSLTNLLSSAFPRTTACAETFDLETGGLMTAADFFDVDEETYTARLTDCVAQDISEDPYHDRNYFAQWEDAVRSAFEKDQFYVTDEAYVVFYQQDQLGGTAETVYPIAWSRLADLLPIQGGDA